MEKMQQGLEKMQMIAIICDKFGQKM